MTPMDISKFEIPRSKLVREIGPVFEKVSKEKTIIYTEKISNAYYFKTNILLKQQQ